MWCFTNPVPSTQYFFISTVLTLSGAAAFGDDSAAVFLGRSAPEWHARLLLHEQARAEAAWALSQLVERNPQLAESIRLDTLSPLMSHPDATVRYWSIHGLQRLALSLDTDNATRDAIQTSLRKTLTDKSPAPRVAAAETLGLLGDADGALPVLIKAMSDPQDAVRIQAVRALEKLGKAARPAAATLRAATTDSSEYVKRISTRALSKLDAIKN